MIDPKKKSPTAKNPGVVDLSKGRGNQKFQTMGKKKKGPKRACRRDETGRSSSDHLSFGLFDRSNVDEGE